MSKAFTLEGQVVKFDGGEFDAENFTLTTRDKEHHIDFNTAALLLSVSEVKDGIGLLFDVGSIIIYPGESMVYTQYTVTKLYDF